MGCDFPSYAYRSEERSPAGKRLLTWNPKRAINPHNPMEIPCQKCMGCRLDKAYQWSVRIMHEAKQWPSNCFLTLTYDGPNCPSDYSLQLRDFQLFMKRLRKALPQKIRYYACGEYGDQGDRPHYHAIVFNQQFSDLVLFKKNQRGEPIYTSDQLTGIWQLGHATTAAVTHDSAAYVARYSTKKITGDKAVDHYYRRSPIDGEYHHRAPEFGVMSRRDGIGKGYTEQFKSDYYPSGYLIVDGQKSPIPRYYKQQLTEEERETLRRNYKRKPKAERTDARRYVKMVIRDQRIKQLKREL